MIKAYRQFSQIVTLDKAHNKDGRNLKPEDLSIIENGSVVFDDEKILWVGSDTSFEKEAPSSINEEQFFQGKTLLPEIVDSHTHIVFGGDRSFEYGMRLNGADYEELAKAGGGILHTMEKTKSAPREELLKLAKKRIKTLHSYGVGTIEIKSGYGLTYEKEKELTLIINDLKNYFKGKNIQIINTYMAAHAVPKTFSSSAEFMDQVVIPLLEELAPKNIIDIVDIFHEKGYFTADDVKKLAKAAEKYKISLKIHADEFHDNDGLNLAKDLNALSADHLLASNPQTIKTLKNSSLVATLLPGTGLFLGKPMANARGFLDSGAKVSMASDYNPGSCHCDNLLLISAIAAPMYKLNQTELWSAVTLNAAHSLGLYQQGAIKKGLQPRFSIFDAETVDHLSYHWGKNFSSNRHFQE